MDDLNLAASLKRTIAEKRDQIQTVMMEGMLKDIEHYKSLQGQLEVLNLVEMTIKDFYKENKFE
ncbi:MAG: hypothetical protein CMJ25_05495 [Phycisphaerae bacterium]|nr:hypothetical protein [Phycisphaerae bacterium]|tara:strand:- start:478 stop:669 length:192 start_codon:yes stop_codon:yes gene_type:complete